MGDVIHIHLSTTKFFTLYTDSEHSYLLTLWTVVQNPSPYGESDLIETYKEYLKAECMVQAIRKALEIIDNHL